MFTSNNNHIAGPRCWSVYITPSERWKQGLILFCVPAKRSNQSIVKEISPGVCWRDWCWSWNSNTLTTWCGELTHWERPQCWERLRAVGEGDDREWDGWMVSLTQCTWVWVDSGSWRRGRTGMLWFMGSRRVGHDWATELNWTEPGEETLDKFAQWTWKHIFLPVYLRLLFFSCSDLCIFCALKVWR